MKTIIITGGAGFIGSHVVRRFVNSYPNYRIVNLDALTYAGNLENLKDIENAKNYVFEHADITDTAKLKEVFEKKKRKMAKSNLKQAFFPDSKSNRRRRRSESRRSR